MKITGIEKKKGSRYTIYVDGEYYYIFDIEIITANRLEKGLEVDEVFLEGLKQQAEVRRARERAYHLLSYRDHSEKELYDKLCKNVSPEIAAQTVARLVEQHLLDDERYAEKLAEHFMEVKRWSYRKSLFELKRRGISSETAEQVLSESTVDASRQIRELLERKYYRYLGDRKGNQKVIAALARLGFQYSDIRQVIEEYLDENGMGEEETWQYE